MRVSRRVHTAASEAGQQAKASVASRHAPKKKNTVVDTFDGAPGAGKVQRSPRVALDFIDAYDRTLGLTGKDLAGKRAGMKASALSFYRATPSLFVRDLQTTFAGEAQLTGSPAPKTTVLVDPHLGNFGTFRGPDGHAVWGVNDFDQSAVGSPELDLERFATSVVLQARAQGLSPGDQQKLVKKLLTTYADALHARAEGKEPGGAFLEPNELHGAEAKLAGHADGAKRKKFLQAHDVLEVDSSPHFAAKPDLKPLSNSERASLQSALDAYAQRLPRKAGVKVPLQLLDVVERRDGGGSSYGLPRYEVLLANDSAGKAPILLELKASPPSPLVDLSGKASSFDARAVAANQARLGGRVNPLSGYAQLGGQSLLVRELEPEKGSVALDKLGAGQLGHLVEDGARVLARAHGSDARTAARLDAWLHPDRATALARLQQLTSDVADQTERDYAAFRG